MGVLLLVIFSIFMHSADSLNIDEAIDIYESSKEIELSGYRSDFYRESYNSYSTSRKFGAIANNESKILLDSTHKKIDGIRNIFSPEVRLFDFKVGISFLTNYDLDSKELENQFLSLTASLNLNDILYYSKKAFSKDQALILKEKNDLNGEKNRNSMVESLIDLYSDIKIKEGEYDVASRYLEQLKKDKSFVEDKLSAGTISQLDIEELEVNIEKSETKKELSEINLEFMKRDFFNRIEISYDKNVEFFDISSNSEFVFDDSELLVKQKDVELTKCSLRYAKRENQPDFDLGFGWEKDPANLDAGIFDSLPGVSLTVSWDILSNRPQLREAECNAKIIESELEILEKKTTIDRDNQEKTFINAQFNLLALQKEVEHMEKSSDIKREMYQKDLISFRDYMKEYNEYRDTKVKYEKEKHTLNGMKKKMELLKKDSEKGCNGNISMEEILEEGAIDKQN